MVKRVFSVFVCIVLIFTTFAGCKNGLTISVDSPKKDINKAQLVVAMNPIFAYDNEDYSLAFNDVKNAAQSDSQAATLTSLTNSTNYSWAYRNDENWKYRGIYNLTKWNNGKGAVSKKINAYSFEDDGTISLLAYNTKVVDVKAYSGGTIPSYGILVSASGNQEEAICYTAPKTGNISIPSGTVTAVESVDGIKTGFLVEDGTKRTGVVKIIINSKEYWSDILVNSTASKDGVAVTELTYPDINNIPVTEGDIIFISVQLDAELNNPVDITKPSKQPEKPSSSQSSNGSSKVDSSEDTSTTEKKGLSIIYDYESRFKIIYSANADIETSKQITNMRAEMEKRLQAAQLAQDDTADEVEYEILVGNTSRKESKAVYEELIAARPNHAGDYIVRTVGNKVVIAATSDYSLELAINYFMENYCKDDLSVVPGDLNYIFREDKTTILLGSTNIASYTLRTEKYPSVMVVSAAKDLREYILKKTGYLVSIEKGGTAKNNEILIGPNVDGLESLTDIENYKIDFNKNILKINVGSTTAANFAIQKLMEQLDKGAKIVDGYSQSGTYSDKEYSLGNGYALTWYDDFTGNFTNGDKLNTKNWHTTSDSLNGPFYKIDQVKQLIEKGIGGPWYTSKHVEDVPEGYVMEGYNIKPNKEGQNYFLRDDCLVEVTRKSDKGYESVRLSTEKTMNFRYGIVESRFITATNNGACASFWLALGANEIDVFESGGKDHLVPNLHIWKPQHIDLMAKKYMPRIVLTPAEGEHFYDTFHYMGFEWTENYIEFYLDGEPVCFVDISDSKFDGLRTLTAFRLFAGVGNDTYNPTPPALFLGENVDSFYEEQIWDFVRVYQKNDKKSVLRIK